MRHSKLINSAPELKTRFQKVTRSSLEILLKRLDEALKDPAHRDEHLRNLPMVWPTAEELWNLDKDIFALAFLLRPQKQFPYRETVKLVNERWVGLHLLKRIDRLVKRAQEILAQSQPRLGTAQGIQRIRDVANSAGDHSVTAHRFLTEHEKLHAGKLKLSQVTWSRYYDLIRGADATIRFAGNVLTSDKAMASYVKYLEWERDEFFSERADYEAAVRSNLEQPIRDWIDQHFQYDAKLEPSRVEEKRKNQRKRSQCYRDRKKALQKSVTKSKRSPSSSARRPKTLRDACVFT